MSIRRMAHMNTCMAMTPIQIIYNLRSISFFIFLYAFFFDNVVSIITRRILAISADISYIIYEIE